MHTYSCMHIHIICVICQDDESMDDATLFRNFLELQNVTDTPEKEPDIFHAS